MQAVLCDVEWQKLRLSFIGHWKKPEDKLHNLHVLREYYTSADTQGEQATRAYRIFNLLDSLRRGGLNDVTTDRERERYWRLTDDKMVAAHHMTWDWTKVAEALTEEDTKFLMKLRSDISRRQSKSVHAQRFLRLINATLRNRMKGRVEANSANDRR